MLRQQAVTSKHFLLTITTQTQAVLAWHVFQQSQTAKKSLDVFTTAKCVTAGESFSLALTWGNSRLNLP